jgi:enamine deaminase RidA (YjgF/YER057c/UK114 family)
MDPEARLAELGIELPPAPTPMAAYVPTVRAGDLVFVAGQGPMQDGRLMCTGKVGADVTVEQAAEAARVTCLNGLAAIRAELGSLNNVERFVQLRVYVASAPGFNEQPTVGNGASELLEQVFGEAGRHARAAVGVSELPFNISVEIEFVVQAR